MRQSTIPSPHFAGAVLCALGCSATALDETKDITHVSSDDATETARDGAGGTSSDVGTMDPSFGGTMASAGGTEPEVIEPSPCGPVVDGLGEGMAEPYAPRSGRFKVLVYSKTDGFRHEESIAAGKIRLQEIAAQQDFDVVVTESNECVTAERLNEFELVFFLNPWGDVFDDAEQQVFEDWMTNGGALVGTHSATAVESGWPFYAEVTGQSYDGHTGQTQPGDIVFNPEMLDFPAVRGLPNPWHRVTEWFRIYESYLWSTKPGVRILGRLQTNDVTFDQPIIWYREWGGFRALYTPLGHHEEDFDDPEVTQHLTGAIFWAVRREHLLQ